MKVKKLKESIFDKPWEIRDIINTLKYTKPEELSDMINDWKDAWIDTLEKAERDS